MPRFIGGTVAGYRALPPVGYQGPGDIVSGAHSWCGLRAYSNATTGNNLVRLRRDSDNAEQDFVSLTDGSLDVASIITFKGAANLFIVKFYNQGNSGSFFDQIQLSASSQAALTLSGIGSLPIAVFDGSNDAYQSDFTNGRITQSQPWTISCTSKRRGNFTSRASIGPEPASWRTYYDLTTNQIATYAGANVFATCSDNTWHSINGVFNGSSSDSNVDGVSTTGDASTGALSNNLITLMEGTFLGDMVEWGFWLTAFTATQSSNLSANQHAYWGF